MFLWTEELLINIFGRKFNDILSSFGLHNQLKFSTHLLGHSLDLNISRISDEIDSLHSEPDLFTSDHRFVKLFLNKKI